MTLPRITKSVPQTTFEHGEQVSSQKIFSKLNYGALHSFFWGVGNDARTISSETIDAEDTYRLGNTTGQQRPISWDEFT